MKAFLFPLLVLITQCATGQSIPPDSFYSRGATWTNVSIYNYGLGTGKVYGQSFTVMQDSVAGGLPYHLIASKNLGGYSIVADTPATRRTVYNTTVVDYGIIGGIRIAGGKVYFLSMISDTSVFANTQGFPPGTERLVYDYNISTGDTVSWQTVDSAWGLTNVVTSVDSVLMSGYYVHRFNFGDTANSWLAGVGSKHGFLGSRFAPTQWGILTTCLLCYSGPSFSYKAPAGLAGGLDGSCFDMSVLSMPGITLQPEIAFFPNPVAGEFLYLRTRDVEHLEKISVYDITGRKVEEFSGPFAAGDIKVRMSPDKGAYLVKLQFAEDIITRLISRL